MNLKGASSEAIFTMKAARFSVEGNRSAVTPPVRALNPIVSKMEADSEIA